tara:strand:+ start:15 stop:668 length:654 start_codon:yes stop_codon:yes gene_type:complete
MLDNIYVSTYGNLPKRREFGNLNYMKYSLRFNPPEKWNVVKSHNRYFFGLIHQLQFIQYHFKEKGGLKMLEIGSYRGESTFMWASSGMFDEIICIDPYKGKTDNKNKYFDEDWGTVKRDFWTNTRYFNNIKLVQDFSYNVIDSYPNNYFDFIYIDASHEYDDVKKDIQISLPKVKENGLIGGHDYQSEWPGVIKAVNERFKEPDLVFEDESWVKINS